MRKKILVVEDEESLLKLETLLLTSKGYVVRAVSDGQAALDSLSEEKADLVLLDILLPLVDGFEICRSIKSNPSTQNIPVVFLSAQKGKSALVHGQQVGADCFIHKPFRSAELLETIDRLVNRGIDLALPSY